MKLSEAGRIYFQSQQYKQGSHESRLIYFTAEVALLPLIEYVNRTVVADSSVAAIHDHGIWEVHKTYQALRHGLVLPLHLLRSSHDSLAGFHVVLHSF